MQDPILVGNAAAQSCNATAALHRPKQQYGVTDKSAIFCIFVVVISK
jgi:hypothetical protein